MDNLVQFPVDADTPIDITSPAFARRLGNLLEHRRTSSKLSVGHMARHSNKHFTRRALRRHEAGHVTLDAVTAAALASLYKVDLDAILPARTEIEIDAGGGILRTGGIDALFEPGDPDSILETYLRLVRRLRDQEHDDVIALRRADIDGLATFLGRPGETVVEQLGALMGATKTQRRLMAGMFIAGAMVITVAVPTVAALTSETGSNEAVGASTAAPAGSAMEEAVGDDGAVLARPEIDGTVPDGTVPDGAEPSGDPIIGNSLLLDLDDPAPLGGEGGTVSDEGTAADAEMGVDVDTDPDMDVDSGGTGTVATDPSPVQGPGPTSPDEGLGSAATGAPPVPGEIVVDLPVPDGTPEVGGGPGTVPMVPPADTTGPGPVDDAPVDDAPVGGTPIVAPPDADDGDFAVGPPPVAPPPDAPVVEIPVPDPTPADESTDGDQPTGQATADDRSNAPDDGLEAAGPG